METNNKKRNTKYANLSNEERKEKYKEAARDWYTRKSREEKKEIINRNVQRKHAICEICNNGKLYANIYEHQQTKMHLKKVAEKKHELGF